MFEADGLPGARKSPTLTRMESLFDGSPVRPHI